MQNPRPKLLLMCIAVISSTYVSAIERDLSTEISEIDATKPELKNLPSGRSIEDGTIFAVVNTPKCGTGGMQSSFVHSLGCRQGSQEVKGAAIIKGCKHGGESTVRTHKIPSAAKSVEKLRTDPQQKCVITTAMRNPQTWLPSMFMQKRRDLCDADMSYEEFYNEYHDYIMKNNNWVNMLNTVRPPILHEFGTDLKSAAEETKRNGGYALYNTFGETSGPFQNCELLFLDMDARGNWYEIFAALYPGVHYGRNQQRVTMCPKVADHYRAIQYHELTVEQKEHIIGGDSDIRDYFKAYGM